MPRGPAGMQMGRQSRYLESRLHRQCFLCESQPVFDADKRLHPRRQIFELLTVRRLFNPRPMGNYSAEQYHLGRIYGSLVDDADRPRLHDFFKDGRHYETFFKDGGMDTALSSFLESD